MVQTGGAVTGEEPVSAEVRPPGLCLQQDVDVADGGALPGLPVSLGHHPELSAMEDDRRVGRAGVVELTGQQVESDTEWFAGNFPEHFNNTSISTAISQSFSAVLVFYFIRLSFEEN